MTFDVFGEMDEELGGCPRCHRSDAEPIYALGRQVSCEACLHEKLIARGRQESLESEADARWEENKEKARKLEASLRAKFIEPIKRLRKL